MTNFKKSKHETQQSLSSSPPPQQNFVSAHDVARLAGVSRSAVSRAFTPGASIAPKTRAQIMKAAETLGYRVNDLARGLLTNHSQIIGMIAADSASPFRAAQIAALSQKLVEFGKVPVLIPTGCEGENVDSAHETLLRYRAEAIIVLSGMPSASFVELARRNGQHVIAIGRVDDGPDHIRINNRLAMHQAVQVFADIGAKQLGLINSSVGSPNLVERQNGFLKAAASFAIPVKLGIGKLTDYNGGVEAAKMLFISTAHKVTPQIDAIFCVNDLMAFGTMDYIRNELNLKIPEDISIIGFDNILQAKWQSYSLSTFAQDPIEMANEIIKILYKRMVKPESPPCEILLEAPLILRASVKAKI